MNIYVASSWRCARQPAVRAAWGSASAEGDDAPADADAPADLTLDREGFDQRPEGAAA